MAAGQRLVPYSDSESDCNDGYESACDRKNGDGNNAEHSLGIQKQDQTQDEQQDRAEKIGSKRRRRGGDGGMRVRALPHVDGNFPSSVFVALPTDDEEVNAVLLNATRQGDELGHFQGIAMNDFDAASREYHISLSKLFVLQHYEIAPFIASLQGNLDRMHGFEVSMCSEVRLLPDDANEGSFLVAAISSGREMLLDLVKGVNTTLRDFGQPTYFEDPIMHVSLAFASVSYDAAPSAAKDFAHSSSSS
eukprot:g4346.t1